MLLERETLAHIRQMIELLMQENFFDHRQTSSEMDEVYTRLRKIIGRLYKSHGEFYDNEISKIPLTELNIGRQYQNGLCGILSFYNNELTPNSSLAILTYFIIVERNSKVKALGGFSKSLVEWTYRVFEKNIDDFHKNGMWGFNVKNTTNRFSFSMFVGITLVISLGGILIRRVLR